MILRDFSLLAAAALLTGALMIHAAHHRQGMTLPNPELTPGAMIEGVTAAEICRPGYARRVREQRSAEDWHLAKIEIMHAYGLDGQPLGAYELDHLAPLEVGGSNDWRNLWPQPIAEAHRKDRDENTMHDAVCSGQISLQEAQEYFKRSDWAK